MKQPMKETIDPRDISVVVQGPIAGLPSDKPQERYTHLCLQSIRKTLPGATIILSTWEGSDVNDLDYDLLVESKDPGTVNFEGIPSNCFRQIVSSSNGLKNCRTKYALKARSDFIFNNKRFLDYFIKFNKLPFDDRYKILKQRIITFPAIDPRRRFPMPFSGSDWLFLGLTEDIQNIFDIPTVRKDVLMKNPDGSFQRVEGLFNAEQYIWFSFISKYHQIPFEYSYDISHDNIATSEKYYANNCIFLTSHMAGIDSLKYPGTAYARAPFLSHAGIYTITDYKRMLNKYANAHIFFIPNYPEAIAYAVVQKTRVFLKRWPNIHDFLRHIFDREYR
jgi:hypothetical protein